MKKVINWFTKQPAAGVPSKEGVAPDGYFMPWTEKQIREDTAIKDKLRVLKRSGLALPYEIWDEFVVDTVVNFALWVQELPASASYHHHGRKGLLYHSLDVAIYAMRIRRNYIMPPNTPPEEVLHREIVWVYGVFLAALFHDCGKIMDLDIELFVADGDNEVWTPAWGPVGALTNPYRFKYKDDRAYLTHQRLGHSFMMRMLGKNPMLSITSDTLLFSLLTEYLSGHKSADNVLELIVRQADAASVAQDLGASKDGINAAAKRMRFENNSFAEQLHTTMTYLLTEKKILLNKKGGEGFVDGEHLYLVCKPIADLIRVTLLDRGISSVPSSNTKLFNELQQHNIIRPNEQGLAVWSVKVELTDVDWYQRFTCLCIHLPSFAPELSLSSMPGRVVVLPTDNEIENDVKPEALEVTGAEADVPSQFIAEEAQASEDVLMSFMPGMDVDDSNITMTEPVALNEEIVQPTLDDLTETQLGQLFWDWIETGLLDGTLSHNSTGDILHVIDGQLFIVSPTAMKLFCKNKGAIEPELYLSVQAGFQALGLHVKTQDGRNFHSAKINNTDKSLTGYVAKLNTALETLEMSNNQVLSLQGVPL
ncbi:MobH family relaxase [Shewanella colwelliana]|uniref:MobH family relaxase n=1 Tax=Shewanella colwelliana TaxID=23 RepID=UPI003735FF39